MITLLNNLKNELTDILQEYDVEIIEQQKDELKFSIGKVYDNNEYNTLSKKLAEKLISLKDYYEIKEYATSEKFFYFCLTRFNINKDIRVSTKLSSLYLQPDDNNGIKYHSRNKRWLILLLKDTLHIKDEFVNEVYYHGKVNNIKEFDIAIKNCYLPYK